MKNLGLIHLKLVGGRALLFFLVSMLAGCESARAENWPVMREVYWLLDKNDKRGCFRVLEPEIFGSLREDGEAQCAYGLLLKDFHRYNEAREHLIYGLKLSRDGYFSLAARETLKHLAESEDDYKAIRAQGSGSVGLILKDNLVRKVMSGSPASHARMLAGDKILTIDSRSVSPSYLASLSKSLRGTPGSVVSVTFLRAAKIYGCRLVRADIDGPAYATGSHSGDIAATSTPKFDTAAQTTATASSIDTSAISIYRRTSDTAEVYESVLRGLGYLPVSLKRRLFQDGLKIVVTPTMEEAAPNFSDNCSYYRDALGVYSPGIKTIYVAERCPRGNGIPEHNPSVADTLLHEVGHAFDNFNGAASSEAFLKAYKFDSQHISNSDRARYNYYASSELSIKELFAELFAIALLPRSEILGGSRGLEKLFPCSFDDIKKQTQ